MISAICASKPPIRPSDETPSFLAQNHSRLQQLTRALYSLSSLFESSCGGPISDRVHRVSNTTIITVVTHVDDPLWPLFRENHTAQHNKFVNNQVYSCSTFKFRSHWWSTRRQYVQVFPLSQQTIGVMIRKTKVNCLLLFCFWKNTPHVVQTNSTRKWCELTRLIQMVATFNPREL